MADGDTQAKDLLQLELDRRTDLSEFVGQVLGVRDGGRELSGLGETGSEQTGDLLNQSFRGQESVVLLGELLDKLLVFVEPGTRDQLQWRKSEILCTNFFKSSTDMYSRSICLARSMSAASARMQIDILGRGTFGSLYT